jgi:hypothetical protein
MGQGRGREEGVHGHASVPVPYMLEVKAEVECVFCKYCVVRCSADSRPATAID